MGVVLIKYFILHVLFSKMQVLVACCGLIIVTGFPLISPGKDSKTEAVPPCPVALVPEEKVSFSLFAHSVSSLTVAKIRKVYNKLDSKAIAKQVSSLTLFLLLNAKIIYIFNAIILF